MSSTEVDALWQSSFPDIDRPQLYSTETLNEDGFKLINDPSSFVTDISDFTHAQLYATSSNNQSAMKLAQDEYVALDKLIAQLKGKETTKQPQQLLEPEIAEERKEAALYGYKYEANKPALINRLPDDVTDREKHDVRLFQEPFQQGGFVPTDHQYKVMLAKARNPAEPDGWAPVLKGGRKLVPKRAVHNDEYVHIRVRRELDHLDHLQLGTEGILDGTASAKLVNKRLTRTRFDGKKHPPTRDVSEASSTVSSPRGKRYDSPVFGDESPVPKRRRLNNGEKPKQPNQYTKPRVLQERASANDIVEAGTPDAEIALMSPNSLRQRKWTTVDLLAAVKRNHSWLADTAQQSEQWKNKILASQYPVRTFSMFKKWAYWKDTDRAKRPRTKKDLPRHAAGRNSSKPRALTRRQQTIANGVNADDYEGSMSPFSQHDKADELPGAGEYSGARPPNGLSGLGIGRIVDDNETEEDSGDLASGMDQEDSPEAAAHIRIKREMKISPNEKLDQSFSTVSTTTEYSAHDEIVKPNGTLTPANAEGTTPTSTPTRRSLRRSRMESA